MYSRALIPEAARTAPGENDGKVRQKSAIEGQEGHARKEGGNPQEREIGQEGDEPQAGDRYRPFGSAQGGRKGAGQEIRFEEKVVLEEDVFEEKIPRHEKIVFQEKVGTQAVIVGPCPTYT